MKARVSLAGSGQPLARRDTSFLARYGSVIAKDGVAAIPGSLFRYQGEIKLTPQLTWFVATILSFKWTSDLPRPSLRKLAERTGVSRNQLLRYEAKLVDMGLLVVHNRRTNAGRKLANAYDFGPLFARLEEYIQRDASRSSDLDDDEPDADPEGYAPQVVHIRRAPEAYAPPVQHTYAPPADGYAPPAGPHEEEPAEEEKQYEKTTTPAPVSEEVAAEVLRGAQSNGVVATVVSPVVTDRQLWATVLADLRATCEPATYGNWLASTILIGLDRSASAETVVVRAPSTFAARWLADHLRSAVATALATAVGRRLNVRFVGPSEED